jgi:hypothetical protein
MLNSKQKKTTENAVVVAVNTFPCLEQTNNLSYTLEFINAMNQSWKRPTGIQIANYQGSALQCIYDEKVD